MPTERRGAALQLRRGGDRAWPAATHVPPAEHAAPLLDDLAFDHPGSLELLSRTPAGRLVFTLPFGYEESATIALDVATPHPLLGAGLWVRTTVPWSAGRPHCGAMANRLNLSQLEPHPRVPSPGAWHSVRPPADAMQEPDDARGSGGLRPAPKRRANGAPPRLWPLAHGRFLPPAHATPASARRALLGAIRQVQFMEWLMFPAMRR